MRQRIPTRSGGHVTVPSQGAIVFKHIPGQGGYWKFVNAARFELWTMGPVATRQLVRTGPKLVYCFRDLQRLRPSSRSPRTRVYGACSQDRTRRAVRLGTSVGWADVYPATYHENFVDVTGLRGCFALWQIADPTNVIVEGDETNNASRTVVRAARQAQAAHRPLLSGGCVGTRTARRRDGGGLLGGRCASSSRAAAARGT